MTEGLLGDGFDDNEDIDETTEQDLAYLNDPQKEFETTEIIQ